MGLSSIDIIVMVVLTGGTIVFGIWLSKKASRNMQGYFLAGKDIPWYYLGLSNASGMFDISGTMLAVAWMFVYGIKSAWLPWMWPVWNQVFMMVFLAAWMRRSNVLTGAEWISFRFGDSLQGRLSHIVTVIFAILLVVAFIAYFVEGIGKFSAEFLPWDLSFQVADFAISNEHAYAFVIILITTLYTLKGGFYSVVGTEVMQFVIMGIACLVVGFIALFNTSSEQIQQAVPNGWTDLWFGWQLEMNWESVLPAAQTSIETDGYQWMGMLMVLMIFKGCLASLAGPAPSYDMQRVLGARSPSEASKMFALTPLVLLFPRYFMIAGITVLALVHMNPQTLTNADRLLDFERILPFAINQFIGSGFKGILLAGLIAAFMSTFAAFINAGSAYIVNDLVRKYISKNKSEAYYIRLSYLSTLAIVAVGFIMGISGGDIQQQTVWIVGLLYGSYVAANVLKWVWWRFNGFGYFSGMCSGMFAVALLPIILKQVQWNLTPMEQFPILFFFSLLGAIAGTLLTKATDEKTLLIFYSKTRPWGFWSPVENRASRMFPGHERNQRFKIDMFNCLIGIIWQTCLVLIPMFLMIRSYENMIWSIAVFLSCSILLKRYWWNKLED